jgi:cell fate regulator YaaT (PSP1 superfamily)
MSEEGPKSGSAAPQQRAEGSANKRSNAQGEKPAGDGQRRSGRRRRGGRRRGRGAGGEEGSGSANDTRPRSDSDRPKGPRRGGNRPSGGERSGEQSGEQSGGERSGGERSGGERSEGNEGRRRRRRRPRTGEGRERTSGSGDRRERGETRAQQGAKPDGGANRERASRDGRVPRSDATHRDPRSDATHRDPRSDATQAPDSESRRSSRRRRRPRRGTEETASTRASAVAETNDSDQNLPMGPPPDRSKATPTAPPEVAAALWAPEPVEPYVHLDPEGDTLDGVLCNTVGIELSSMPMSLFDAGDLAIEKGDQVIVDTDRGVAIGRVVSSATRQMLEHPPAKVRRRVGENEARPQRAREREDEAFEFCRERIRARELPMKLIRAEFLQSGNKAIFFFSAENRVDFRELVKDLARRLHARIEMRQVGVRDESRMSAGIGPCGRELCCSSWIKEFQPVSIRMAKDQNLVLNPTKVSGMCGRLKCCLAYEQALYREARSNLPKVGHRVTTPAGEGRVHELDIPRRLVRVLVSDGSIETFAASEVSRSDAQQQSHPNRQEARDGEPRDESRKGSGWQRGERSRKAREKDNTDSPNPKTPAKEISQKPPVSDGKAPR